MSKKLFRRIIVTVVIVVVIVIAVLVVNLDRIVKEAVEYYGPQITKVSVTADSVHLGLGTVEIKNFVVGNPDGYKTPQAVSVGDVSVAVNPLTVFSDKIDVLSIKVKSPDITFEGGFNENNLSQILDNVNGTARTNNATVTTPSGKTKPAKKLEVDDFIISGAKVHVNLTELGSKEMTLTIPDIQLSNLGTGPNGITPADLASRVLSAITSATLKAVSSQITNLGSNAANLGKGTVNSVKGAISNLFKK
ncbi:MAG TPA: AsmA family protein [Verrucomicrobiae bacterium]|jgi:uncharacterized protein involved in outer membrane biogenesis